LLCTVNPVHDTCCPRCNAAIHFRKPGSLTRCTALVIAALVLSAGNKYHAQGLRYITSDNYDNWLIVHRV
jgi:hypothetical protein